MNNPLTIVHISAECAPYAKSGGLGDVVQQLPTALTKQGHNVCTVIPHYGFLEKQNVPTSKIFDNIPVTVRGKVYQASFSIIDEETSNPIFLVGNEELFGTVPELYDLKTDGLRFLFFDFATVILLNMLVEQKVTPFENGTINILHCHDWHTGIIPQLLRKRRQFPNLENAATVYTIHNLDFQGQTYWKKIPRLKRDRGLIDALSDEISVRYLNFTRRAILCADVINTVSERYALEILTKKFGQGLDSLLNKYKGKLYGIINGVDYSVWNPRFDDKVYVNYDVNSLDKKVENKLQLQQECGLQVAADVPLIGLVNRLTEQKGFDLIVKLMPQLLKLRLQLVVVGSGNKQYIRFFRRIAKKYPQQLAVSSPFTEDMASKVYAASDMYLMPSRFEPCGISQLISLRYGSVPIVHSVGGLQDTISDFDFSGNSGNGFAFAEYTTESLAIAIARALEIYKNKEVWQQLMKRGMQESFSWNLPAAKYAELYHIALGHQLRPTKKSLLSYWAQLFKVQ